MISLSEINGLLRLGRPSDQGVVWQQVKQVAA